MPHLNRSRRKANERRRLAASTKHNRNSDFDGCLTIPDRERVILGRKPGHIAERAAAREAYRAAHPGGTSGEGGTIGTLENNAAVIKGKARQAAFAGFEMAGLLGPMLKQSRLRYHKR